MRRLLTLARRPAPGGSNPGAGRAQNGPDKLWVEL
jgi:hypothetical protein